MPADLLLIVEGRRDEAVLRAIIEKRTRDLGIREVSLEFRHRSGAVYTEGIEVAAIERQNFRKVILLWDQLIAAMLTQHHSVLKGLFRGN